LPEGTGKSVKVAVVAEDAEAKKAKTAGASVAGVDEIFSKLDKEQIDFDVLVAVPELMQRLSKYARILGPKGLMPNPKSGTVTKEVEKAVKDALSGKVEYRVDSAGIVHITVGKVSFGDTRLHKNAQYIFESIKNKKPASVKSPYIKSFYVSSTMGPGIRVNTSEML
jgi:large subunit ribosomal protein L1